MVASPRLSPNKNSKIITISTESGHSEKYAVQLLIWPRHMFLTSEKTCLNLRTTTPHMWPRELKRPPVGVVVWRGGACSGVVLVDLCTEPDLGLRNLEVDSSTF
ncbi:hypothetical protein TNCV_4272621 [Trichonephila clavipes]|nr:hypothetical protein TNCV_4272621 [Trichonephila clavipes]